jgi:hypothetical protein
MLGGRNIWCRVIGLCCQRAAHRRMDPVSTRCVAQGHEGMWPRRFAFPYGHDVGGQAQLSPAVNRKAPLRHKT